VSLHGSIVSIHGSIVSLHGSIERHQTFLLDPKSAFDFNTDLDVNFQSEQESASQNDSAPQDRK
jgi:hypothetical protein